jgi:hypothetical protein
MNSRRRTLQTPLLFGMSLSRDRRLWNRLRHQMLTASGSYLLTARQACMSATSEADFQPSRDLT